MWSLLLTSLVAAAASRGPTIPMRVTTPLHAQHVLADVLATAESVDWVRADDHRVTFAIDRAGEAYTLVAFTGEDGRVIGIEIEDAGLCPSGVGELSWLTDVMKDRRSITALLVNADGNVTLVTDDDERYQAMPGHGGNARVEGRWAASWNV
jgi:hypothetical protein